MAADAFDLAGFCVGFVESDEVIDAGCSREGDVIVGIASSGLHSNGFSLIRRLIDTGRLPLTDDLLAPTALYAPIVLELVRSLRANDLRVGGLAHITGGGLARNLPRALPAELGARVWAARWPRPEIFAPVAQAAALSDEEMRATFNCGIGFAAVVPHAAADHSLAVIRGAGFDAWLIGDVRPVAELGGRRYVEA
jgi:phosphoribosylformylglycinamidine cyclo-ligase